MKYIKPETILLECELSNLIMGSRVEKGIGDPSIDQGLDFGDGNIGMSKHYSFEFDDFDIGMSKHDSFEFDDSDDSFNDSWD